jgi:hypothetical protein
VVQPLHTERHSPAALEGWYFAFVSEEVLARPAFGARLLVKLESGSASDALYAATVTTGEQAWGGKASVGEADGEVSLGDTLSGELPPWLAQALRALLRSAWQRRRAGHPWPRRLARWRPEPGATENE